jgi:hypothetical protein
MAIYLVIQVQSSGILLVHAAALSFSWGLFTLLSHFILPHFYKEDNGAMH